MYIKDQNTDTNICDWFWWISNRMCAVNHHPSKRVLMLSARQTTLNGPKQTWNWAYDNAKHSFAMMKPVHGFG
jgi:hypothetical protein